MRLELVISYRNGIQIVGDVLRITNEFGLQGVNITLLLRKANLSYNRLSKLSQQLMSAGLLEEKMEEGKRLYLITEKGREYLKTYEQFESLATSFGLEL
ncbi:MAG: winged helix-turn-helix domain-containing protein [Nitrososphaerales archaeon]